MNVYNKVLLNATTKCQYYSFYSFIGKPTFGGGGGVKLPPPSTQIRVKTTSIGTLILKAIASTYCLLIYKEQEGNV